MLHSLMDSTLFRATVRPPTPVVGPQRWLLPYADMLTLLFGVVVVLQLAQPVPQPPQPVRPKVPAALTKVPLKPAVDSQATRQTVTRELTRAGLNPVLLRPTLSSNGGELTLSLPESMLFAPGEADLSRQAAAQLDKLAGVLARHPGPIRVEGHTDHTPITTSRFPSNWELSTARATQIVQYLITQRNFDAKRLSAAGYGEFHPIASNATVSGQRLNRRVDVVLILTPAAPAIAKPPASQSTPSPR